MTGLWCFYYISSQPCRCGRKKIRSISRNADLTNKRNCFSNQARTISIFHDYCMTDLGAAPRQRLSVIRTFQRTRTISVPVTFIKCMRLMEKVLSNWFRKTLTFPVSFFLTLISNFQRRLSVPNRTKFRSCSAKRLGKKQSKMYSLP